MITKIKEVSGLVLATVEFQRFKLYVIKQWKIIKELYKNICEIYKELLELEIGNTSFNFLYAIANILCSLLLFRIHNLLLTMQRY